MSEKIVVVTGGSSGMGGATVAQLVAAGHRVHNLDVQRPAARDGVFHHCDLSDREAIDSTMAALPDQIDALINVAGIADAPQKDKVVRVNFLGLRHLSEGLLGRVVEGGSITIVSSVAALDWQMRLEVVNALLDTHDFEEGFTWSRNNQDRWIKDPYTYSKQCALAYTYRLAGMALNRRVRANAICPGGVATPLTPEFRRLMGEEQYEWSTARVGRDAEPEEIAEVICYVAVGPCNWLNGIGIPLDGGASAGGLGGWADFGQSPLAKAKAARRAESEHREGLGEPSLRDSRRT